MGSITPTDPIYEFAAYVGLAYIAFVCVAGVFIYELMPRLRGRRRA